MATPNLGLLGKLSPEIRNMIYELVLPEPEGIPVYINKPIPNPDNYQQLINALHPPTAKPNPLFGLPQTCKETRQETLQMCYALNKVTFYTKYHNVAYYEYEDGPDVNRGVMGYHKSRLQDWAQDIGEKQRELVKEVVLDTGVVTVLLERNGAQIEKLYGDAVEGSWLDFSERALNGTLSTALGLPLQTVEGGRVPFVQVAEIDTKGLRNAVQSYLPNVSTCGVRMHVAAVAQAMDKAGKVLINRDSIEFGPDAIEQGVAQVDAAVQEIQSIAPWSKNRVMLRHMGLDLRFIVRSWAL